MLHSDCGAYGGLAAFDGDRTREAANHDSDLQKAADFLKSAIHGLEVLAYFVDFEGVWEVDAEVAQHPARKAVGAA